MLLLPGAGKKVLSVLWGADQFVFVFQEGNLEMGGKGFPLICQIESAQTDFPVPRNRHCLLFIKRYKCYTCSC